MTFDQIEAMSAAVGDEIELESFIHGAACMSYSGRCMLSSFLTGRSANRGACSQPCRWTYTLHERTRPDEAMPIEEDERGTAILSSRDICMMDHLPRLMESGVCCFKVEGRMKTEIYIATVVGAYRRAMDAYANDPEGYKANAALQKRLRGELDKISHRVYDTGFYFGQPKVCGEAVGVTQEAEYMGYVLDVSGGEALVEMKNRFFVGDELETVTPKGSEKLVIEDIVLERTGEHVGVVNVPMERQATCCAGRCATGREGGRGGRWGSAPSPGRELSSLHLPFYALRCNAWNDADDFGFPCLSRSDKQEGFWGLRPQAGLGGSPTLPQP